MRMWISRTVTCRREIFRILGKGYKYGVVLTPGPVNQTLHATPRGIIIDWTIFIDLFARVEADLAEASKTIREGRDTLISHINQYATVTVEPNRNALGMMLESGGQPSMWQGDAGQYWSQRFSLRVSEKTQYGQGIY